MDDERRSGAPDDPIASVLETFREAVEAGVSSRGEFERLKGRFLGREKGLVPALFSGVKDIPPAERGGFGARANAVKREIVEAIGRLSDDVARREAMSRERAAAVDVTLPGRRPRTGALHPLTIVRRRVEEIFLRMGYSIADGPEIENDFHNFEALNFPPEHPARDTQDTFFLQMPPEAEAGRREANPESDLEDRAPRSPLLLRTHTSPVQIREMRQRGAPLRMIMPGRVYRKDEVDATHSPVFHQVEALVVDKGISLADLKGTVETFLSELFGAGTKARFIPTFFPFVEPGADVHMTCIFCRGAGCRKCKGSGWIEIMGAGCVHPNVLVRAGIDPETYTGFAFGGGIDRIALLLYGFPDLRLLFEGDERFLGQYAGRLLGDPA
ncbi:MAG: phenylalanine--tRNA ligase subunit alpha [Acidobacteria bacterium]|nr:phenylalanine--tRNA ligase subunit alpha [Acidobacteriota bacterium]MCA1610045.1 phenylalanine--tRNA ligase subunit alpha [Acidobacteriota bacterium]